MCPTLSIAPPHHHPSQLRFWSRWILRTKKCATLQRRSGGEQLDSGQAMVDRMKKETYTSRTFAHFCGRGPSRRPREAPPKACPKIWVFEAQISRFPCPKLGVLRPEIRNPCPPVGFLRSELCRGRPRIWAAWQCWPPGLATMYHCDSLVVVVPCACSHVG